MTMQGRLVDKPIAVALISIAILLAGLLSYLAMPVSDLPQVEYPTIQVSARLPGADPETMAASVATPLERQFSSLPSVEEMTSISGSEVTSITLRFSLARDIDQAALDVQAALTRAARQLPPDMPGPPTFRKVDPGDLPVIYLGLTSKSLPMAELTRQAETVLVQELSAIDGVALVNVYGAQKYAVRIDVDPGQLTASGIGLDRLAEAIASANANVPIGMIHGDAKTVAVSVDDRLDNAADFSRLIVGQGRDAAIRLGDVADVRDGVQNDRLGAWIDGERGILLAVDKQIGANVVHVVEEIHAKLPAIRDRLPPGIELGVFYDRTSSIRASIRDVSHTLWIAVALVVGVVAAFLRRLRSAAVPAVALPLSLAGALVVLHLTGGSVNNFTMLAMTLAVGFVVDDAIVVLESISRRIEHGSAPRLAAVEGATRIAPTVFSMTVSLAIVFVPLLFLDSVVGRLLAEFAVVIIAAVCVSGLIALYVTPVLCANLLGPMRAGEAPGQEPALLRLKALYLRALARCIARPRIVVGALALMTVAVGWGLAAIPKGFLPNNDTGQLSIYAVAAEDITFEAMSHKLETAAAIIRADPGVASVESFFGVGGGAPTMNVGRMIVALKPAVERDSAGEIVERLRPQFDPIAGLTVYLQSVPTLRLGLPSKTQHQYILRSSDISVLYANAPRVADAIRAVPGIRDVNADLYMAAPRMKIAIDRDAAAALQVDAADIKRALNAAFGPRQVSTIYGDLDQYAVLMQVGAVSQKDSDILAALRVQSRDGGLVPISAVTTAESTVGPSEIGHKGQFPSVAIAFDLAPGTSLSGAIDGIRANVAALMLPDVVSGDFQGSAQVFEHALEDAGLLFLLALGLIYLVLGVLYESFALPFAVIAALPTAVFGALVTLFVAGMDLDVYAAVGLVLLLGIAKKNAIILVDAASRNRREGATPATAIVAACEGRFRPIIMTSLTAIAGALPIAFGYGADAESRRPLGMVVLGGLLFSHVMTLFVTPALYLCLTDASGRFSAWCAARRGVRSSTNHGEAI
jgi:hydrophobe/amphiphile efflux-1 (HAE1) family protein